MGSPVATFLLVGDQPWAEKMVESVNRVTGYPVVQMSDKDTRRVHGVDDIVRIPMNEPLMPYRLKHLARCPYDKWVTFDTDILIKKRFDDVWERRFDVALTQRLHGKCMTPDGVDIAPIMPFNTGVMFSREPDFWYECYDWLCKQEKNSQDWWGDQLAVAHVAQLMTHHVLVLPGEEFNWTPDTQDEKSEKARIWHFKGANRKQWMLSPTDLS